MVAIIDRYSKAILSWRLSNTCDKHFCIEALEEALANHGSPDIFNTDQGCQFTSPDFTKVFKDDGIKISMDGKGRALDNIPIERF
jgi:putative transposase